MLGLYVKDACHITEMSETSPPKDCRVDLRVTQQQKELLERAANLKGVSLSAYTLFHLLPIARQDIDSQERLVLSDRDRDLFMSVMENPPELKGKLKTTLQKFRKKYDK
ncbi:DUF1778 domain-containing protein [Scytonema sp. UIC 10036]|uniref:type II toxin-antitoxin system TacA family antitoxin n=1 Tax=Scytonema sp. UIC 10036 TaxID=2304196 RepID=UPI001FAAEA86|nr:DUF1778 domain-containing protein [Scytonema sp. UIC 10036]